MPSPHEPTEDMEASRILVIDDDEDVLALTEVLLGDLGLDVSCSIDPVKALLRARERWDLVLTDLIMPDLSGVEVVRHFREVDSRLPVIVLSQCQREDLIMQAYAAGATDYIAKPFEPQALQFRVQLWLSEAAMLAPPTDDPHQLLFSEGEIEQRLEQGRIDFDRFQLISLLGQGSGGVVYRAREHHSGRIVALKILDPSLTVEPDIIPRFLRERDTLASVRHRNIVSLFEIGCSQGLYFYSMEWVDGPSLRQVLGREGGQPPERIAAIGADVSAALAHLHAEGVVHRDIKPGNILLPEGCAKLVDFGLAKQASEESQLTSAQVILGTPGYLAPEEILGASPSFASDVYGLGITLVEMALGELPFSGDSTARIIDRTVHHAPGDAFGAEAVLAGPLAELVKAMVHPEPRRRPSAEQACAHLAAIVAGG